jgi:hypothetical protein
MRFLGNPLAAYDARMTCRGRGYGRREGFRDGELITASVTSGFLEGIIRGTLIELCRRHHDRRANERDVDRT